MSIQMIGMLGLGAMVVLILLRVPVAVALGLVGFVGYGFINGWGGALRVLGQVPFDMGSAYALSQVPLFILMGDLAMRSGMAARLFEATKAAFAGIPAAQCFATIGAAAGFGAVSGSSLATAATITRIAVPEMRKAGYDDRLSAGSCAAGGTLGILVPPSIPLVIYALIAEQSVPRLYAAALIPSILLTLLLMLSVIPVLWMYPSWVTQERRWVPWHQRIAAFAKAWDLVVLVVVVIGGLYAGLFTATESAAIGCFGAWVLGYFRGQLDWKNTWESLGSSIRVTCVLFTIVFTAVVFTYFITLTQIPQALTALAKTMELGPVMLMTLIVFFYVVLGCFMEAFGIILVTVPVFLPVIVGMGYDPVWFGVVLVILIELGMITPPVGMNIFVVQAQLPDISTVRLYQGILPFLWAPVITVALLVAFPGLATWFPTFLFTRT